MRYKQLVNEILNSGGHSSEDMAEILNSVIGKAINQERIQIYKTLVVYLKELSDKNKKYLVNKIKSNEEVLMERENYLKNLGIKTNLNEFFDYYETLEDLKRVKRNLRKNTINAETTQAVINSFSNELAQSANTRGLVASGSSVNFGTITSNDSLIVNNSADWRQILNEEENNERRIRRNIPSPISTMTSSAPLSEDDEENESFDEEDEDEIF